MKSSGDLETKLVLKFAWRMLWRGCWMANVTWRCPPETLDWANESVWCLQIWWHLRVFAESKALKGVSMLQNSDFLIAIDAISWGFDFFSFRISSILFDSLITKLTNNLVIFSDELQSDLQNDLHCFCWICQVFLTSLVSTIRQTASKCSDSRSAKVNDS